MDVTEGALQAAVDDARVVLVEAERRLAAWRGAATAGQPVEPQQLPQGWTAATDNSGRAYYLDNNNKTTHWSLPDKQAPLDANADAITAVVFGGTDEIVKWNRARADTPFGLETVTTQTLGGERVQCGPYSNLNQRLGSALALAEIRTQVHHETAAALKIPEEEIYFTSGGVTLFRPTPISVTVFVDVNGQVSRHHWAGSLAVQLARKQGFGCGIEDTDPTTPTTVGYVHRKIAAVYGIPPDEATRRCKIDVKRASPHLTTLQTAKSSGRPLEGYSDMVLTLEQARITDGTVIVAKLKGAFTMPPEDAELSDTPPN